ncbi:hypothetical protein KAM342_43960 [Aeromonas caviae]|nr:hypothetical protein KAM342_43960 [Aeromonas caviae]GJA79393.1 hypothetical protein KAM354_46290 [Aeromonas caviae]GJA96537.1 hypothetical protein KAM358_43690 [Aeromonas caviae]
MIVTMLGVTWKIRSWKTGKVPFRPLFVYKSQVSGGPNDTSVGEISLKTGNNALNGEETV